MKKSTIFTIIGFFLVILLLSLTIGRHIVAGKQPTLTSFSTIHFAGYLFFIVMPVEALMPYYIAQGYNLTLLLVLAVITALIAQLIDYGIGYLAPNEIIKEIIGIKKYKKSKRIIDKYGKIIIFIFNLFPLSSPIVVLVAGMMRFKLKHTIFYSFLGLFLKYFAITTISYFF